MGGPEGGDQGVRSFLLVGVPLGGHLVDASGSFSR